MPLFSIQARSQREQAILAALQDGAKTRAELCAITGIPRTTVYDTLIRLWTQDKVRRFTESRTKKLQGRPRHKGRPWTYWELDGRGA